MEFILSSKNWLSKNYNNLLVGILSGLIASIIWTIIVKNTFLKGLIFGIVKAPICLSKDVEIKSDYLSTYNWDLKIFPSEKSNKYLVYVKDNYSTINKNSLKYDKSRFTIEEIDQTETGDISGFILTSFNSESNPVDVSFKAETSKLMERGCSNFLFSF